MDLQLDQAFSDSMAQVTGWIEGLIRTLPDIVGAVVVLILFWFVAKTVRRIVTRLLDRATDHGPVKNLVGTTTFLVILAAGLMVALGILDLEKTVTSLLAGVGIIGLALGFAFQDIAANLISGVMMSVRRPFTDGDLIETGDFMGIVQTIDLRATTIRTLTGQEVRIPNSSVHSNAVVNYSTTGERRVDVACGVTYTQDLEAAAEVALEAARSVEGRDESREPELLWESFGGSSIDFVLRFWIPFGSSQKEWLEARSNAMVALKKAFDEAGVGIPYPILTLDFDDVGGRRLSDELAVLDGASG